MGFEVRGVTILSFVEYHALARSFDSPDTPAPPALVAWAAGEPLDAWTLYVALDLDARLSGGATERTHALLDVALDRLAAAFPGEVPGLGRPADADEPDASQGAQP